MILFAYLGISTRKIG